MALGAVTFISGLLPVRYFFGHGDLGPSQTLILLVFIDCLATPLLGFAGLVMTRRQFQRFPRHRTRGMYLAAGLNILGLAECAALLAYITWQAYQWTTAMTNH